MANPAKKRSTRKALQPTQGSGRTMLPDDRRRSLMDAAERIFVRKGFAITTVDDITGAAGVAKGTFYLYFSSKEDLLSALRERFIVGCRERIAAISARVADSDWLGQLDTWVEGGIRHYLEHIELHDVLFLGAEHHHGSMADSPLVVELTELVRGGAAAGAWNAEDPALLSLFLFYAIHGVVDHVVHSHPADVNPVIRLSKEIARRCIGVGALSNNVRKVKRS